MRVLIVDDSYAARDGLRSILGAFPDVEVVGEAGDGQEAVTMAERLRPSIILMDAQMPGMDGAEATRLVKERWPEARILLLAVHASSIDAALAAGADCCLMKDSNRHELLRAIRNVCGAAGGV